MKHALRTVCRCMMALVTAPLRRLFGRYPYLAPALSGLGAGFLNGLLGAAGGILLVAVLPYLTPPPRLCDPAISERTLHPAHMRADNTNAVSGITGTPLTTVPSVEADVPPILPSRSIDHAYGRVEATPRPSPLGEHLDRRDILATALSVMLPVSAVSWVFYWFSGVRAEASLVVSLILPALLGGLAGAKLLGRLPEKHIRKMFAALVVVSGLRMLM